MTKDELWRLYATKNPAFEGEGTVTLTRAGLRKLFEQTWEKAHERGVIHGRAIAALEAPLQKDESLFGRIFGPSRGR